MACSFEETKTNGACVYLVKGNEVDEQTFRERLDVFYNQNYIQGNDVEKANDINIMMTLIEEITNDTDDNDDTFSVKTKSGSDITVQGDIVSAERAEGPADNEANIGIAIDMALVAKATDDDDIVFMGGNVNDTETAVMLYAAELAGLTVGNAPEGFEIPDEIKAKMDTVWQQKQADLGPTEPEVKVDANLTGPSADAETTVIADLGMTIPTTI